MNNVSVIVPCYNAERFVMEAIFSVVNQPSVSLEIILIDDGSTDRTAEIVSREFPSVRIERTPNRGASAARNRGTELARGDFIQYLDADDILSPGKIAQQVEALERSGAEVAYGDFERFSSNSERTPDPSKRVPRVLDGDLALRMFTDFWCPPAVYLFRKRIVEKVGGWNLNLPVIQDARFALDCALHGARFVRCDGVMARYREHSDSLSKRSRTAFLRDILTNDLEMARYWQTRGGLPQAWRTALLQSLQQVAQDSYCADRETFERALNELEQLEPGYRPKGSWLWRFGSGVLGVRGAVAVAACYTRLRAMAGNVLKRRGCAPAV